MCVADFDKRQDAATMSVEERLVELAIIAGPLEIPFDKVHRRIEKLIGRPVWTHELADFGALFNEIRGGHKATLADVVAKVPPGKKLIVVSVD